MDLLLIIGFVGGFILTVKLYISCVTALNRESQNNYGYRPINIPNSLLVLLAYVLAILGILMGGGNMQTGLGVGLLLCALLFIRVAFKTSFLIALLALPLLAIAGALPIIVLVLLYLLSGVKKQEQPQNPN